MVLVDSALDTRVLDKDLRDAIAETTPSPLTIKATAPLGIPRLLAGGSGAGEGGPPEGLAEERNAVYNGTRHLYAVADESATVQQSVAEATDAAPLARGKAAGGPERGGPPVPQLHEKAGEADRRADQRVRGGLINFSENSELVVAKNSEHYIQFDRPCSSWSPSAGSWTRRGTVAGCDRGASHAFSLFSRGRGR